MLEAKACFPTTSIAGGFFMLKRTIKREVGKAINQSVSYIIFVDKIDKNKIGKKQRNIMKKRFEKGEFSL